MSVSDSELRIRPGRIRNTRAPQQKSFINQVLRAAKKAGHTTGQAAAGRRSAAYGRSTFGRGRLRLQSQSVVQSLTPRGCESAYCQTQGAGLPLRAIDRSPELSPNFGDGLSRSGGGGCGLAVGRLGDDLDPVVECHTENEFWQLVMTVEAAPASLRALDQFEDHRERGLVG